MVGEAWGVDWSDVLDAVEEGCFESLSAFESFGFGACDTIVESFGVFDKAVVESELEFVMHIDGRPAVVGTGGANGKGDEVSD